MFLLVNVNISFDKLMYATSAVVIVNTYFLNIYQKDK